MVAGWPVYAKVDLASCCCYRVGGVTPTENHLIVSPNLNASALADSIENGFVAPVYALR